MYYTVTESWLIKYAIHLQCINTRVSYFQDFGRHLSAIAKNRVFRLHLIQFSKKIWKFEGIYHFGSVKSWKWSAKLAHLLPWAGWKMVLALLHCFLNISFQFFFLNCIRSWWCLNSLFMRKVCLDDVLNGILLTLINTLLD